MKTIVSDLETEIGDFDVFHSKIELIKQIDASHPSFIQHATDLDKDVKQAGELLDQNANLYALSGKARHLTNVLKDLSHLFNFSDYLPSEAVLDKILDIFGEGDAFVYYKELMDLETKLKTAKESRWFLELSNSLKRVKKSKNEKAIVFCERIDVAKILNNHFQSRGFNCDRIVGSAVDSQTMQKTKADQLRSGKINVLFATSVISEGFDIPEMSLVVRYRVLLRMSHEQLR